MQFLVYCFFLGVVNTVRFIPFAVLYAVSDALRWLMYNVIGYRKKVVFDNIKKAFPNFSAVEIEDTAKKFYTHLCDISLESLKGFTMSREAFAVRMKFIDPNHIAKNYFAQGQNIIGLTSHYGNWEWGAQCASFVVPFSVNILYKPLSNKYIDAYFRKKRGKGGSQFTSIRDTAQLFARPTTTPTMYLMAADQSPSNINKAIWANLLNIDTACLHGPEYYSIKHKLPLVYCHVKKVKRGYYEIIASDLNINHQTTTHGQATQAYMSHLSQILQEKPEYWLWSHKRWKHKR
ncbi:MAG: hypothetical protein EAZ67_04215 [Cytophagales bacterium]|nr:MAG: hypothetical protein EAZ67_04215 [Cytophagales bacterium]